MIDLHTFRIRLKNDLEKITADLSAIATYDETTDNWEAVPSDAANQEADINVEADEVESWNERRATLATLETEYRDIKRALAKIAGGTFGICEISGQPIELKRLEIKPTVRTCAAHMNEESSLSL